MNDKESKTETREELEARVSELRKQMMDAEAELKLVRPETWRRSEGEFYLTYYAWSGAVLGMFGAVAGLLVNVLGSLVVGQHPLRLIQVYLTFPLGEKALSSNLDTGVLLAAGCCLYILTGMVLAIPLHLMIAKFLPHANLRRRLGFATVVGLLLWAVNFYLVLSWLQPLLCGGDWITNAKYLPPWIGAGTHLVFAWVVAALYPWGTIGRMATPVMAPQQPAAV